MLAPLGVVQAAIGNLLRNAIENSDRGVIRLAVSKRAVVTIEDPGHGMSPEEVAQVYARMAKGERNIRSGIGLDLIARLCDHLGWKLDIQSQPERGTRVTLDMSSSLPV
ncbi:Sensor protein EvgS precursor [compost metagenome]